MGQLKLDNACKSFGTVDVIRDVNLDVQDGEFCVFVGPSGCGKSTLLRMIAGLEDISSGDIRIDGQVVNTTSRRRSAKSRWCSKATRFTRI